MRHQIRRLRELVRETKILKRELLLLVRGLPPRLLEVPGVGTLTAAKLIAEIAGIERFRSEAKLARLAGIVRTSATPGPGRQPSLGRIGFGACWRPEQNPAETLRGLPSRQAETMIDVAVAAISASDVGLAAALLGGFAGLLAIGGATRAWWRRTLGRRADRYARITRLGTGAHLPFFIAVLGEPPAMRITTVKEDYVEYISPEDPGFDPGEVQTRLVPRRFGCPRSSTGTTTSRPLAMRTKRCSRSR